MQGYEFLMERRGNLWTVVDYPDIGVCDSVMRILGARGDHCVLQARLSGPNRHTGPGWRRAKFESRFRAVMRHRVSEVGGAGAFTKSVGTDGKQTSHTIAFTTGSAAAFNLFGLSAWPSELWLRVKKGGAR